MLNDGASARLPTRLNRRAFIGSTAAAVLAGCATPPDLATVPVIDTHTHFYDPARPQGVPWPDKNDSVLYRTVLPVELKTLAQPLGVRGTVVVEASPWIDDNHWLLDLARHEPFILGFVGHLNPGQPGFSRDLDRFAANRLFRGIRIGGASIAPDNSVFIGDLKLLAKRDLSLDVLGGADDLGNATRVATALPELRIVLNHCAGVRIDGRPPDPAWVDAIRHGARPRNVFMKISGLAEGTGKTSAAPSSVEYYRPVLDILCDEFGPDRVLFGSNWPVSARFADYATVLGIVRAYFSEKSLAAQEKYFFKNAQRIYGVV